MAIHSFALVMPNALLLRIESLVPETKSLVVAHLSIDRTLKHFLKKRKKGQQSLTL